MIWGTEYKFSLSVLDTWTKIAKIGLQEIIVTWEKGSTEKIRKGFFQFSKQNKSVLNF